MNEIVAGALLGFVGSLHCVAMCGPLVLAFAPARTVRGAALYHSARITMYALLGSAAGVAGTIVAVAGLGRALSLAAGLALIAAAGLRVGALVAGAGAVGALRQRSAVPVDAVLALSAFFAGLARRAAGSPLGLPLAGAANALLPCGLVYAALTAAATSGHPSRAALVMLAFGAGTLPALLGVALAGASVPLVVRARLRFAIPLTLAAVGVLLVARATDPHATHLDAAPAHDARVPHAQRHPTP